MKSNELKNYKIEKTYFRNNPNFGRTTTLKDVNGKVLVVLMGSITKAQAVESYKYQKNFNN